MPSFKGLEKHEPFGLVRDIDLETVYEDVKAALPDRGKPDDRLAFSHCRTECSVRYTESVWFNAIANSGPREFGDSN
jgi:hypothetical protein